MNLELQAVDNEQNQRQEFKLNDEINHSIEKGMQYWTSVVSPT